MSDQQPKRVRDRGSPAAAPSPERTLERYLGRRRAQKAWDWVGKVKKDETKSLGEKYAILARKLPSMLQVSGLGQTFAFLYSKGYEGGRPKPNNPEGRLLEQLGAYLRETQKRITVDPMETLLLLSPSDYRAATREIMAVAEWLKRFADGQLAKESGTKESSA